MSETLEQPIIETDVCELYATTIDIPSDVVGLGLSSSDSTGIKTTNVSEIDLSGYNYDLVLTYKMIEDPDDQDSLFRIQFLQAFGINDDEYHPEIVSAVIDDLYERYRENKGIRDILQAHPLYRNNTRDMLITDVPTVSDVCDNGMNDDNSEMIFCMMFSFQLFDLFHTCIRHAKRNEEIPSELHEAITECFHNMF